MLGLQMNHIFEILQIQMSSSISRLLRNEKGWKLGIGNEERIRNEWLNGIGNGVPLFQVRKAKRGDGSR
jgi:hypothetical protein